MRTGASIGRSEKFRCRKVWRNWKWSFIQGRKNVAMPRMDFGTQPEVGYARDDGRPARRPYQKSAHSFSQIRSHCLIGLELVEGQKPAGSKMTGGDGHPTLR